MEEEEMRTEKGVCSGGAILGLRVRVIPSGVRLFYAVFWPVLALAWGGFFLWTGQFPAAVVCGVVTVAALVVMCWQLFGEVLELSEDQCVLRGVLPASTRVIGRVGEVILYDLPDGQLHSVLFLGEISAAGLPAYPSVQKALQWIQDRNPDLPVTHAPAEKYQPPFFPALAGMLGFMLLPAALAVAVAEKRPLLGIILAVVMQMLNIGVMVHAGLRKHIGPFVFICLVWIIALLYSWHLYRTGLVSPPR